MASHRGVGRSIWSSSGRNSDEDEAPDHVRVVGGELGGHGPARVVPDDAGAGQAEVGAEGIQKPAAVAYPVPRERLVRLAETGEIEGIHGELLREASESWSQIPDEDSQPWTSRTGGPPPMTL